MIESLINFFVTISIVFTTGVISGVISIYINRKIRKNNKKRKG